MKVESVHRAADVTRSESAGVAAHAC